MRIGINEVLIYDRASGARQRELTLLPAVLKLIESQGWESVVYVSADLKKEWIAQLVGDARGVTVIRTPLPSVPTYKRVLKGVFYWRNQVVIDKLDMFHTAYFPVPKLPIPTVLTVHDVRWVHFPDTYKFTRRLFLHFIGSASFRRATRLIVDSYDTQKDLTHHFDIAPSKTDVIYIPSNPRFSRLVDPDKLEKVKHRYNLPERFILYVGHLEPRKNLKRLIQAFVRLRHHYNVNHNLVILGKPSFGFDAVFAEAERSDITPYVLFTGYVEEEDLSAVYSLADVLAFPSLHEGFGIPVLEGMACGVPVVTSNVSALPEIAGDAAILVDPYNIEAIADGIKCILFDNELRQRLISKGFERLECFDVEKLAKTTLNVYHQVLGV